MNPGHQPLAELADWYGSVIEFDHADQIDWDNHAEVVREAFTASDCGNFAHVLAVMTGWPVVLLSGKEGPVHALVRAPDGRLLDASGWVTPKALAKRYGTRRVVTCAKQGNILGTFTDETNDEGINEELARVVSAVRAFPWAPFNEPTFQAIAARPFPAVDRPETPAS